MNLFLSKKGISTDISPPFFDEIFLIKNLRRGVDFSRETETRKPLQLTIIFVIGSNTYTRVNILHIISKQLGPFLKSGSRRTFSTNSKPDLVTNQNDCLVTNQTALFRSILRRARNMPNFAFHSTK